MYINDSYTICERQITNAATSINSSIFNKVRDRLTEPLDALDKYYIEGFWPIIDGIEESIKEEELNA